MKITRISPLVIKTVISADELSEYEITPLDINTGSPNAAGLLMHIINTINSQTGINLSNEKIFIEAFPCPDESCVMYFSIIRPLKNKNSYVTLVCDLPDKKTLSDLCIQLSPICKKAYAESELYRNESVFRIILKIDRSYENRIADIFMEYGNFISADEIMLAFTREHSECIYEKYAVENSATE